MDRKNLPLIMMLAAGAVTCVITFVQQYTVLQELIALLIVLVVFYGLGSVLKWTLDYFDAQNEKKMQAEGEVIEKGAEDNGTEEKDAEDKEGLPAAAAEERTE